MKSTENEETDTKVLYAPTQFYDACDDCDTLPEDRWEEFRHKLEEEKRTIIDGRERVFILLCLFVFNLINYLFVRLHTSLNEVQVVYLQLAMF
jgi:hypothetical protein